MSLRKIALPLAITAAGAYAGAKLAERQRLRRLNGLRIAITGGTRGLGLALARLALRHGASVALCARDPREVADAAEILIAEFPDSETSTHVCDITNRDDARGFIEGATALFGGLDILINNAGVIQVGPWRLMNDADFEESINTHVWGPIYTIAAAADALRASRGRIINISSIGGKISVPHLLPYNTGKFALAGLSEGLAVELAKEGIAVTTVCPGLMRTGSPRNAWFKGQHRREYAWFSIGDSLPLLTVSAESAARRILAASMARRRSLVFPFPIKLAAIAHDVAPGVATRVMSIVNRLLPAPKGTSRKRWKGKESGSALSPSPLTWLNERAARSHNQFRRRT